MLVASGFAPQAAHAQSLASGGGGGSSSTICPASAGDGIGGAGGSSSITGAGADGRPAPGCGGAGGGGAGATGGAGGSTGAATGGAGGASAGADGGDGGNFPYSAGGGGGGGGGAHGAIVTTSTGNSGVVAGGNGGNGGHPLVSVVGGGGGGGGGGYGVVVDGTGLAYTNTGTVAGGFGGNGGFSVYDVGGFGGNGGNGIVFTGGGTLTNSGDISGGDGGLAGSGASYGLPGLGGVGIVGANLSIVNSGSIAGGLAGNGSTRARAIYFTSGVNTLELQAGSTITGDVVGANTDTLRLGGAADSSFDVSSIGAQYTGFSTFEKTGSSTWTLTGTTLAFTSWTIDQGALAVSSNGNLGNVLSGPLTFDGGALQFLADVDSDRQVILGAGGGSFDTDGNNATLGGAIGGAGKLSKAGAGTLTLTGANSYAGGTTISAGTLQLGNGGTSGAIIGDVIDDGALAFDRSDVAAFAGNISGSGGVQQLGSGTTILTGVSSYTGATTVASGTLQVDGGIASATTVRNGGTLTGRGTVGGVTVESGGSLSPGGTSVGTLTVAGNLALNAGSILDVALGSPGSMADPASGASGRLVVSGDLAFDATVNLSQSADAAGGTAGIGYYRLVTYGGNLTSNTAAIGATPTLAGADLYQLQAGSGHIDLFIGASGAAGDNTLQFWQGGDGVWNAANPQWLNQNGTDPVAWAGNYAVFRNSAGFMGGAVDVEGAQSFKGLQFVDNGYALSGAGQLVTDAAGSEIRVLADNATIATTITGAGGITKTEAGTLTLTGANTYAGGTTISAGTLQLGDGRAAGSILGDVVDNGVLAFNRADTLTLAGNISGNGSVRQIGSGTTILTGANTYTGDTKILAGTLQFAGPAVGDGGAGGSGSGLDGGNGGTGGNAGGLGGGDGGTGGNASGLGGGDGGTGGSGSGLGGDGGMGGNATGITGIPSGGGNSLGGNLTVAGGTLAIVTPATVDVAGAVTLADDTALAITAGSSGPSLSADSVTIGNGVTFDIAGIGDASQADKVLIDTRSGITGDFGAVTVGGFSGAVDYLSVSTRKSADNLQYLASYGLSWMASNNLAHGTFTLTDPTDSFMVGMALADQPADSATGWDGKSLTKAGAGTLILSADNSYTGGTMIAAGTLQLGDGGASGSIVGDVLDNGVLAFDRSDALTFSGTISGSGAIEQIGSGTTILTGSNSYTGGTQVAAGTLVGTVASIRGDIANAGTVEFAQATDASFAGNIAGLGGTNGAIVKSGAGNLTLTGVSSLDWTIKAGGLTTAAERFTGNAAIQSGATLTFDQDSDASYAGVISGAGDFTKAGSGSLMLTGDSSAFAGTTTIAAGLLSVNGKLGGTLDLVGGKLGGNGTFGTLSVSGMVAPGNSIGTLDVGSITFNPGSIYQVEVDAAGQSDKIVASGAAAIDGGSVEVLAGSGNYAPQTRYTILTAAGGRTGAFTGGVTSNLAFLDPSLSYDANNVYLTLTRNDISFRGIGVTPNQVATAAGVESLGLGDPVYDAVLNLSAPQARGSFDALSGEIHASAKTAMIEDSRFLRNAVDDRIRAAFGGVGASNGNVATYADGQPVAAAADTDGAAVWGQGFGSRGNWSGDGNAAGLDRSTGGFFLGADAPVFDTARFGVVAGYSRTSFKTGGRMASGASDNYHLGLYGGAQWGNLAFRSGAAYTWQDVSTSRSVAFPGFGDSLKGGYHAGTAQVFGELGYRMQAANVALEPFANLAWVNLHTDGFTEKGGAAALTSDSSDTDAAFTTLGLRAATSFDLGGMAVTAKGALGWRRAFGDVTPSATMRFAGGGDAFSIGGVPIARNAATVDAGLDFALSPGAMLGVSYGGQFGSGRADRTFRASFNVKF